MLLANKLSSTIERGKVEVSPPRVGRDRERKRERIKDKRENNSERQTQTMLGKCSKQRRLQRVREKQAQNQ